MKQGYEMFDERLHAKLSAVMSQRAKVLEDFAAAYIAETGLMPSDCELVQKEYGAKNNVIVTTYHFRRREPKAPQPPPVDEL